MKERRKNVENENEQLCTEAHDNWQIINRDKLLLISFENDTLKLSLTYDIAIAVAYTVAYRIDQYHCIRYTLFV